MDAFSYVKSISKGKTHKRRKYRYRIVNRKRFICSQLILCILIIFLITIINNPTEKEVKGQEQEMSFELTSAIESEPEPTPNLAYEHIIFLSELPKVRNIPKTHVSRGGMERNIEKYKDLTKVQVESVSTSNTKSFISQDERYLLEQLVEAEAKDESLMGKIAVANVVLNRLKSEDFPNTITEVIVQKGQFTPVANGTINNTPSEDSILAVKKAIDEGYKVFGPDIMYFCNKKIVTNKWIIENKKEAMTIGNHTFYFK
jgi:N-acetylmuramoyl-L-alanine amidase